MQSLLGREYWLTNERSKFVARKPGANALVAVDSNAHRTPGPPNPAHDIRHSQFP
jgi:hypothetical protein